MLQGLGRGAQVPLVVPAPPAAASTRSNPSGSTPLDFHHSTTVLGPSCPKHSSLSCTCLPELAIAGPAGLVQVARRASCSEDDQRRLHRHFGQLERQLAAPARSRPLRMMKRGPMVPSIHRLKAANRSSANRQPCRNAPSKLATLRGAPRSQQALDPIAIRSGHTVGAIPSIVPGPRHCCSRLPPPPPPMHVPRCRWSPADAVAPLQ